MGGRHGLELAGHKCIGFCEFDKFATASYTSMHLITDEQREYLSTFSMKKRQQEILKGVYRNGEWYRDDVRTVRATELPESECWIFGAPCQSFSVAGKRAGLAGASGLVSEIFRLLEEIEEENRPEWLIYENVKGMLSSNRGLDYLYILSELDRLGYDVEWQNIDSEWFVPQHRERIYTVGHHRRFGSRKIFPIEGTNGENHVSIMGHRIGFRRALQTYSDDGVVEALDCATGGNRGVYLAQPVFIDLSTRDSRFTNTARCLEARYYKGIVNHAASHSGVAIPVLTPDRLNKRQNGRRFKENGEPMFTLTSQDRHGVMVALPDGNNVYAVWNDKLQSYIAIRRLTPKECFRLQGWTDDYFERAAFVNSDSQLYKQAGNGITVPAVQAIGERMF